MNVTLFGATGKTGKYLIEEGLRRGVSITVFARPESSFQDARVRVVRGKLLDTNLLAEAIRGADAVLSALGPVSPNHPKDLPIARATEAIIAVMQTEKVDRLVAVSTGTAPDPGDTFDLKVWLPAWLIRLALPSSYRDIIELARIIRTSAVDWTMVRVALLKSQPATHRLNVGLYGHTKHSVTVSREDVASFMFDQISSTEFLRMSPGISAQRTGAK